MQENLESPLSIDFVKEREAGYRKIYQRSPIISSHQLGWQNLGMAYDWYPVEKVPKIISRQHGIGIFIDVPSPTITERKIGGDHKREDIVKGSCVIIPANTSHQAEWNRESGALTLSLAPTVLAQTIYEIVDPDTIELLPQFATPDPLLFQIGVALKTALMKNSAGSHLYAESLVNSLMLHLLERKFSIPMRIYTNCILSSEENI